LALRYWLQTNFESNLQFDCALNEEDVGQRFLTYLLDPIAMSFLMSRATRREEENGTGLLNRSLVNFDLAERSVHIASVPLLFHKRSTARNWYRQYLALA